VSVDDDLAAAGLPPLPRTAWLAIDLDRLAGNLAAIRAAVGPDVRVEPVVKADAYGHGAVPVARALEAAGADGLSVATWDEAVELREGGVGSPILILYPVPPSVAIDAGDLGVTLTVGDPVLLERTLAAVEATRSARVRVEVEIETGLGRGGLPLDALAGALDAIEQTPRVILAGAWTHLGTPDDPVRSGAQALAFQHAEAILAEHGVRAAHRHAAASGGILADTAPFHAAVRPGLMTYGVVPDGLVPAADRAPLAAALRAVLELRARPVRVVELPPGTGVSYGSAHVTARWSRIATLPVGYGDGYQRAWTNRVQALVRGMAVPLVGTIAMDAVMADVTDVPGHPVTVDDEFVLLGEQGTRTLTAADLARSGTTISWEVLAGMARRLPRVYYAAARAVGIRTLAMDRGSWQDALPGSSGDVRRSSGEQSPA
jgi:alanine racemase